MFELLFQIDQQRAADLLWQVRTSGFAWSDKKGQRDVLRQIRGLAERPNPRPSLYDQVDEETCVRMIGNGIAVRGRKWIDRHPRLMRKLNDMGVGVDEAVRRYKVWLESQRKAFRGA